MSKTSLALSNLRAFAILLVVSFHSVLAYVAFKPDALPFATPPYTWRAFPIADPEHWFGFDLFCAFQYVFLMPFMFFMSGLFVWPSLVRRGASAFIFDRSWRIGVPFLLGAYLLMPVAHYPVYRLTASDPSWSAFLLQWIALPFWATGPLWFLWQLLALDIAAALLYRFARSEGERLAHYSAASAEFPGRYFIALAAISALAYLPFAAIFKPWDWSQIGPFAFQPSRLLHYVVYFFAGLGIGARGIDHWLLRSNGMLSRRWAYWSILAIVTFVSWMLVTAVTMDTAPLGIGPLPHLEVVANLLFVLSGASACFAFAALFLRFAGKSWAIAKNLSVNAYGIYLVHYLFVVWLQYLLIGIALSAVAKAFLVFTGALLLSWGVVTAFGRAPSGAREFRTAERIAKTATLKARLGYARRRSTRLLFW
jgi:glucans biosynthesis protein C